MSGDSVFRGSNPPGKGRRTSVYDVIAPSPGEPLDVTILDSRILGVVAHWVIQKGEKTGRSRVCDWFAGDCVYCQERQREIWLGFLAVIDHRRNVRAVLRLGPEAAKKVASFNQQTGGLRGLRLKLACGMGQLSRAVSVEASPFAKLALLPTPHPLETTLQVVLGAREIYEARLQAEELGKLGPNE